MDGAFFETWGYLRSTRATSIRGKSQPPLYFYRDSNKKEIDLIIYQDGVVSPIEIKKFCAKGCRKEFQRAESY